MKYPSLRKFEDPNAVEVRMSPAFKLPKLRPLTHVQWKDGREGRLLDYIYSHEDLEAMRGNPSRVLAAMDEFAKEEDFLISIGPHKAGVVADLVATEKPRIVVELGGYLGYSAILFADHMRKAAGKEHETQLRVWSLEAEPLFAAMAMSFVDLCGLSHIVKIVTGKAAGSLRRLRGNGEINHADWLFLDHMEELYLEDFKVFESLGLLQPGTTVIADNVVRPGAPEYREYVRALPQLTSQGVRGLIIPGELEVCCLTPSTATVLTDGIGRTGDLKVQGLKRKKLPLIAGYTEHGWVVSLCCLLVEHVVGLSVYNIRST